MWHIALPENSRGGARAGIDWLRVSESVRLRVLSVDWLRVSESVWLCVSGIDWLRVSESVRLSIRSIEMLAASERLPRAGITGMVAKREVGADIDNKCGKCGDGAHVIVSMSNGRIGKVECKQCNSQHRHRLTDAEKQMKPAKRASRKSASAEPTGPLVEPDLTRPIRPYQISEVYAVGDRIDHTSFGTGIIERVMSPSKVQVYFPDGQKMLLQGRTP
jgi:hypothetical protein